jgi:threonine dehydrogenase-like Zn-dependent dehydrogenase
MKAVCWFGAHDIQVRSVPDPKLLNARDAIIRVTSTAICGSDLHLYNGYNPTMRRGDILGHEFMGEVVECGGGVEKRKVGERVIVPFPIACGRCFYCARGLWSLCDNTNPNASLMEELYGFSTAGLFGYSHLTGGYAGGQAEFVRVPFADVGPFPVPDEIDDAHVLFLTDILPTAYMAVENCDLELGDNVAVWGCGPVGQLTIRCALLLGAARVIAIDRFPERLQLARAAGSRVDAINYEETGDAVAALKDITAGRGPDACIDAVGMEAHGMGFLGAYDRVKHAVQLENDRPTVFRQAIQACRKGGTVSVPGVYTGFADKIPLGALMEKGLTLRSGQTHVHRYLPRLLKHIQDGDIDPTAIITHDLPLEGAADGYAMFNEKRNECIKVVLHP